jgi:hypothetical protein
MMTNINKIPSENNRVAADSLNQTKQDKTTHKIDDAPKFRLDFDKVYEKNLFMGSESRSGEGASLEQTHIIRKELPIVLNKLRITSFLDLPCGDFNWMKLVDFGNIRYIGGDVVEAIVKKNQELYFTYSRSFRHLNLLTDPLPKVDVVFCRDCLVHMSFSDALSAISNIKKSKSKYLISTTFTDRKTNEDLAYMWRPLNLMCQPFNFPEPMEIIIEGCTEGNGLFSDKSLGIWKLSDI